MDRSTRLGLAVAAVIFLIFIALEFKPFGRFLGLNAQDASVPSKIGTQSCELKVVTYSGILAEWGPGPELARLFFHQYGCNVVWLDGIDPSRLIERARAFDAQVVVGLDQAAVQSEIAKTQLQSLNGALGNLDRSRLDVPHAISIDWAPIGVLYRKGEFNPPRSFSDLRGDAYAKQATFIDPRQSTIGRLFFRHFFKVSGDAPEQFGSRLKLLSSGVSPGWSKAYGLFQGRTARYATGFLTSRFYHLANQKDDSVLFWNPSAERPILIEYAGLRTGLSADRSTVAQQFLIFLRSPIAQKVLFERNWMLPISSQIAEQTLTEDHPELESQREFRVEIQDSYTRLDRDYKYTLSLDQIETRDELVILQSWFDN